MEESAIKQAFATLKDGHAYDNLYEAAFCRAKADWLVGMNMSRLFSLRYNDVFSIGRVQTPTLAMIVARDMEVENFIKTKYFTADLNTGDFIAQTERIDDESEAIKVATASDKVPARVTDVKVEAKTENPPKLYDLTTLEREANRKFGYTAEQTDEYIQKLYEAKYATYPRTDSQYITSDMEDTFTNVVRLVGDKFFGLTNRKNINVQRCINDSKVSDHHAIIATAQIKNLDMDTLPKGERDILLLISAKMVLATMEAYKTEQTKATILSDSGYEFAAKGVIIKQEGFKAGERYLNEIIKGESENAKVPDMLPDLKVGDIFDCPACLVSEHFTSPPRPYTDDTLLKAMSVAGNKDYDENSDAEKKGIGTPATRAGIITTLLKRNYIYRNKKQLISTEKGRILIKAVPEEIKSAKTTAEWEMALKTVEKGTLASDKFMQSIENNVTNIVSQYKGVAENAAPRSYGGNGKVSLGKCPSCGKDVRETPKAYGCSGWNEGCKFTIWKEICGKKISQAQAKKLLEKGSTDLIKGFVSRNGKTFDAKLIFDGEKISFKF